jgi:hypothetical protein
MDIDREQFISDVYGLWLQGKPDEASRALRRAGLSDQEVADALHRFRQRKNRTAQQQMQEARREQRLQTGGVVLACAVVAVVCFFLLQIGKF